MEGFICQLDCEMFLSLTADPALTLEMGVLDVMKKFMKEKRSVFAVLSRLLLHVLLVVCLLVVYIYAPYE